MKKTRIKEYKQFITEIAKKLNKEKVLGDHYVLWDCLAMLRGPDGKEGSQQGNPNLLDWTLKNYTTGRIRAILGFPRGYNSRLSPEEQEVRDDLLYHAPDHFREHYKIAVQAIWKLRHYNLLNESNRKKPQ